MESAMLRDGRKGYLFGGEEKYRMEIPDGSFGTAMTVNQVPFQQSSHLGKCAFDGIDGCGPPLFLNSSTTILCIERLRSLHHEGHSGMVL
jgi:hypothetical protein